MTNIDISTLIAVSLISLVPIIAMYLWIGLALQAVFSKAGEEGWKGWVPVLNTVVLLELGGFAWWWVLLLIIPGGSLVVYVVLVIACHRIGTRFGYGAGMTVLAALLFPVWASVIAWGRNRWVSAREVAPRGAGVQRSEPQSFDAWRAPMPSAVRPAPPVPPQSSGFPAWAPAGAGSTPARAQAPAPTGPVAAPAASAPAVSAPTASSPLGETPRPAPVTPASSFAGFAPAAPTGAAGDDDLDGPVDAARQPRVAGPFTGTVQIIPAATEDSQVGPRRAAAPGDDAEPADDVRAQAPIHDVPEWSEPAPAANPWAPPAPTAPPQMRPFDPTAFSDTSGEVSAVAGAPSLGAPMSARSSVSALRQAPELPDPDDAFDETIIASRRRTPWMLVPPLGAPIAIQQDVIIIGRRPTRDPAFPNAQLVSIVDETRTVSKTHARLELKDDTLWAITDLDSTNGVVIIDEDGTEIDVEPYRPLPVLGRFLLGDAELAMERDDQ
ncbi:DUF5684 domain-containing protein [Microbacterium horticulturae]|uniref:DUF5684 domain-containing protein n=1 Tax=Microbacterium horticulturae TaxID=3028316 RepID=A0ABY8BZ10_9MICO|nr:DUF5684 domain-containing protein [Microbacterium sp. KACC 23027]WEG09434.1 DUF5684 domain-containing protein [Microbacterium sp. KACC 23027]